MAAKINRVAAQDTTAVKGPVHPGWIRGVVLDEYSQPLKGATIMVKGKTDIFKSEAGGRFEVNAPAGSVLVFTYPDHLVNEVRVTAGKSLVVKLDESYLKMPKRLDVLYGTADRTNVLGSISTIYTNQLTTTPASLYVYALPGQLPGLYTQQVSGFTSFNLTPLSSAAVIGKTLVNETSNNNTSSDNSEFNITVRGQSPITVIDGVQREISSLDPESIESISVLKDGLSTILLGINSSKPVVLVTTKSGEVGKPRITFTAATGVQQSLGLPKPLPAYQYAFLLNENLLSDGKVALYNDADFAAFKNHTDPYRHPDVNWFKTILNDYSPMSTYKLNVNGGTNVARYSVSLGYFNQGGIFKTADEVPYNTNTDLSRYIINSDVGVQVTKNLNVDLQLFGRIQTTNEPGASYTNILSDLYNTPNFAYPVRNPNGSFGGNTVYTNNLLSKTEYSGYTQNKADDILANLDINYDLSSVTKGLTAKLKGNLSYQSISALNRSLTNAVYSFNADSSYSVFGGALAQNNSFATVYTSRQSYGQLSLNYDRQFGKSNISGTVLYDTKSLVTNYDLAEVVNNLAFKAAYNYDGKYFLEAAVNRSGDNRYAPGRQYGTFYAAGAGWQMGNEGFIKDNISWINSWKWRGTYARTGNGNIGSQAQLYYTYLQTYGTNAAAQGRFFPVGTNYTTKYYYFDNTLANPLITWESADKIDFGTDIALLKNHVMITADYYHDKYFNQLGNRGNTIALLGIPYTLENIRKTLYQGGELAVTYKNNVNNFNYFVTGNINLQKSKILFMDELATPYPWNRRTGLPANGTFYGYTALGFYQTLQDATTSAHIAGYTPQPGDIKYKDLNNDGVIDQFDQSTIGGTKPLIFYGLNFGFNYKGFSLSVIFQGVKNRQINSQNPAVDHFGIDGLFTSTNQVFENATGRWTPETANTATLPRLAQSAFNNNSQFSTFWLKSGDYLRLKNAEIGYTIPHAVTKRLRLSGLRVFVNGENLFTVAGFKGLDPEVTPYNYPIQRVLNAGISIKL
ncbi:SusC/RagA family TonB-linked outer membrane protein [Mucilaginibacter sabulilitoris]|uniref:SusC/RagA family TonB-linked outer membrane protein n=1 Tax=Mucilaginibacter sabulilitoris TaxID=1173583 RepID=A0ABZ0TTR4_9SPHI|nr:SusC/RagA family TonB-linked outer membrane protein [Mucilaginibacter sabulilitoris]WPU96391.1 SusC/RagA family TonB-linked outer membrane protein [Mucilaginibacter sabulilitoris]